MRYSILLLAFSWLLHITPFAQADSADERFRSQVHFTPSAHWVNDPNGMVYYNGVYHLFFQYHPGSSVWGPMHWGHATSKDLVHWNRQPVALYPDSLGTVFSGSAVVDSFNTCGLGTDGKIPLIAIYTAHNEAGAAAGRNDFQTQAMAYSLDEGKTWTKYAHNPVLANPGIIDFRDPKLMWFAPQQKWIMTLATKDRITFYSSPDLKAWTKETEFGETLGAHGGVWECPDLIQLTTNGMTKWILIVNLNPGGPNGGSATQYFVGDFDGHTFTPASTETKWLDYGPDEYAGITWSNTGNRKIFLGWMSNWMYANQVPTESWRNGMTLPRDLYLYHYNQEYLLGSRLVPELNNLDSITKTCPRLTLNGSKNLTQELGLKQFPARLQLTVPQAGSFRLIFTNDAGDTLSMGFDAAQQRYFIDRSDAGLHDFNSDFAAIHYAPRLTDSQTLTMDIVLDRSSVELFGDDGRTVMTAIFFPTQPFNNFVIQTSEKTDFRDIEFTSLKSIW